MKIHKLIFENINSLKGQWEIDFDNPDLSRENIFLITGKTGSGKSSILDAITLALYEKTPRQGSVTGSTNEIMNKHSSKCFSEVHFSVDGTMYVSTFKQHRARQSNDGKLQGKSLSLINQKTGENLISKSTTLEKEVTELIGLNFEQFSRTVMLAQGSFDKFLKSDPAEKATILEQITGTQIYSEISKKVYEHYKNEDRELEKLNLLLNGIEIKTDEEIIELKENKNQLITNKESVDIELKLINEVLTYYSKLNKLEEKLKQLESEKLYLEENSLEFTENTTKISNYNKALPIIETHKVIESLKNDNKNNSEAKNSVTTDLEKTLIEITKKEESQQSIKKQVECEEEKLTLLSKTIKEVRGFDKNIIEIQNKEMLEKATLKNLTKNKGKIEIQITTDNKNLNLYKIKQAEAETYFLDNLELKKYENIQDDTLTNLKKYFEAINKKTTATQAKLKVEKEIEIEDKYYNTKVDDIKIIENYISLINQDIDKVGRSDDEFSTLLNQKARAIENIEELQILYSEYNDSLKKQNQEQVNLDELVNNLQIQTEKVNDLNTIIEQAKELKGLRSFVHLLKNEEKCPLCGSIHHPTPLIFDNSEFDARSNKAQEENKILTQLTKSQSKASTAVSITTNKTETLLKSIEKLKLKVDVPFNEDNFKVILNTQTKTKQEEIDKLKIQKQHLSDFKSQLNTKQVEQATEISSRNASSKRLNRLKTEIKEFESEIIKFNNIKTQLEKDLDQFILSFEYDDLFKMFSDYNSNKKDFISFNENIDKTKNLIEIGEFDLKQLNIDIPAIELSIEKITKQLKSLKKSRFSLFEDKDCDNEFEAQRSLIKKLNNELESITKDLTPLYSEKIKFEQKLISLDENILKLENQIVETRVKQNTLITKAEFNDIEYALSLNLTEDILIQLQLFVDTYKTRTIEYKTLAKDIEKDKQALLNKKPDKSEESALEKQKNLTEDSNELLKNITILEQLLISNNKNKQKFKQQQILIDKQKSIYGKWEILNKAIGSADGKKFKAIAQAITLDYLIINTNQKLIELSPRYELFRINNENNTYSLELGVIDNYSAAIRRPVSNLSGGESFIVSFALALGLSDLLNKSALIETLFLDEGFGTLDEDTLTSSLEAIDSLSKEGRVIGIISHVALLHERIRSQILVLENGDSTSSLSGPGVSQL